MRMAGPMESRVRAALLRLCEVPEILSVLELLLEMKLSSTKVCREVGQDGERWPGVEAVQRIGIRVSRDQAFNCAKGWSELDDTFSYSYVRGQFILRKDS